MPINKDDYPPDWEEIRKKIMIRAGGREDGDYRIGAVCEQCGVRNYSVVKRNHDREVVWSEWYDSYAVARDMAKDYTKEFSERDHVRKFVVIVLTVAHWDNHNPLDVRPGNLKAVCQQCHNEHDAPRRAINRARPID